MRHLKINEEVKAVLLTAALIVLIVLAATHNHHAMKYKWLTVTIQNNTVWELIKEHNKCDDTAFLLYVYKKSGQSYTVHNGEQIKIPVPVCN